MAQERAMGERKKRVRRTKPSHVWGLWNDAGRFWVCWEEMFSNKWSDAKEGREFLAAEGIVTRIVKLGPIGE